jgi:ABC-type uncharacterized transport system permease subunit
MTRSILFRNIVRGCKGGLIATAVMTVYRVPVFRALPPTAEFWSRYIGHRDAEAYLPQGVLLHFLYGMVAGGLFGPLFSWLTARQSMDRPFAGVVYGLVYGLLLSVIGTRIMFEHVIDNELEPDQALVFHVGHAIYGLTLGTWLASHERFGDVYEDDDDTSSSPDPDR